jgi:hypothetical protein
MVATSSLFALAWLAPVAPGAQAVTDWPPHDLSRPRPAKVTPRAGVFTPPPPDAIVLFDGTSLNAWRTGEGAAAWTIRDGYAEVMPGGGQIATRQEFGDVQVHVEWAVPTPTRGEGQEPGNSGVFLMGRYEVQILDRRRRRPSYGRPSGGALHGRHARLQRPGGHGPLGGR